MSLPRYARLGALGGRLFGDLRGGVAHWHTSRPENRLGPKEAGEYLGRLEAQGWARLDVFSYGRGGWELQETWTVALGGIELCASGRQVIVELEAGASAGPLRKASENQVAALA